MRWIPPLVVALALSGCFFDFERLTELLPGDIAGRLVREDGSFAAFAQVRVEGTSRLYTTDADGEFLVRGLPPGGYTLRFREDENGDGLVERAALRSAAIHVVTHADGLFGGESKLSWVSLGDVELAGVVTVSGRVADGADADIAGADVYVVRDSELPEAFIDADGTQRAATVAELTVEARTASKADGTFYFPAVAAGDFKILAVRPQEDGTAFVSPPEEVSADGGDEVDVTLTPLRLLPPPPAEREVQLELAPTPATDERVKLFLAEPKTEEPPNGAFASFEDGRVFPGAASIPTTVPLGVHGVFVGDEEGRVAHLGVHVASPPGEPLVIWGLGFLDDEPLCPQVLGGRDCDRDGAREIPPGNRVTQAILLRCTDACIDAFGSANGDATCEVSGIVYDCDDDGDGQPDMTEPFACRTVHAGGDWDHDGRCALDDPFDDCVSNDPADPRCGAGTEGQDRPPLAPEYDGVDFFEEGFDAGPPPTDGGPDDAGAGDAGAGDAGAGDAGAGDAGTDAGADAGDGDAGVIVGDAGEPDAGPISDARTLLTDNGFVDTFPGNFTIAASTRAGDGFAVVGEASAMDLGPSCPLPNSGAFVARFASDGACTWARTVTLTGNGAMGSNYVVLEAVAGLPDGSVAIGGFLVGSVDFGGTGPVTLSADSEDGFVVVYDFAGDPLVARTLPSTLNGRVVALGGLQNAPGELFAIGQFAGDLDLAGGADPALQASTAATDGYVARLGLDLSATWLTPMEATGFSSALDGATTASGTTEHAVIGGLFNGTLQPTGIGRTAQDSTFGDHYVVTVADDGTVGGVASFDGFGFELLQVGGSPARGRVVVAGDLPGGDAWALSDNDGGTTLSLPSVTEPRWLVLELDADCTYTQDPQQLTALDANLEVRDVAMDDRGVLYAAGQLTGSVTVSGTSGPTLSSGSISAARAFAVSWRPAVDDPLLDVPLAATVDDATGAVHEVLPLADDRVFALGDVFTQATFEATSVAASSGGNAFAWRLTDGLSDRQLVVAGDSWAKPLARQRFVEIGDVTGLAAGGFALTGTYPVGAVTPPLDLGGACEVLDRAKEFSFVAAFDASGACRWVRTVETYDAADAGPGGATGITFQNGVVELPSGRIVTAMTARSASFTFGEDESGVEQIVSPQGLDHWGVTATYAPTGELVQVGTLRPFSQGNGEQVSLNAIGLSNAGGYALAGAAEAAVQLDTGGGALSSSPDANVTTDGFFANVDANDAPTYLRFAGSVDTGATMDPVAITLAGSNLVAVGYASGDVFPITNLVAMDFTSVWVARLAANGTVQTTSAIRGVWGDDLVLAAAPTAARYVVATNSGYDDQMTLQVEDPAGSVSFSETGTVEPMTVLAFYDAATGAPVTHEVVRGPGVDATVAVRDLAFTADTEMWVSGYAIDGVQFVNSFGTPITYPSALTEMAFAIRFSDAGGDDWSGGLGARSFVGDVTADGATALSDGTLLMWGQIYGDARFIGWDWFQPGTGNPGFDYLWFVPPDTDE